MARLVGRVLGAMGILTRGHLVETDRSGLVAEYAGQTAPKTQKRIDKALNGVLFIDEAYSLIVEKGDNPYHAGGCADALETHGRRGRTAWRDPGRVSEADGATALSNPGLSCDFSRTFVFPDCTAQTRPDISDDVRPRLLPVPGRDFRLVRRLGVEQTSGIEHFGNSNVARNVFERWICRLVTRLAGVSPLTARVAHHATTESIVRESICSSAWRKKSGKRIARVFESPCSPVRGRSGSQANSWDTVWSAGAASNP